jgi:hypothetical protein
MTLQFTINTPKPIHFKGIFAGKPSGGKTLSALKAALALTKGDFNKIFFVDTENRIGLYAEQFPVSVVKFSAPFDVKILAEAVENWRNSGLLTYDSVLIVDSFSNFWDGEGGTLDKKEKIDNAIIAKAIYEGKKEWEAEMIADKAGFRNWGDIKASDKVLERLLVSGQFHIIFTAKIKEATSMQRVGGKLVMATSDKIVIDDKVYPYLFLTRIPFLKNGSFNINHLEYKMPDGINDTIKGLANQDGDCLLTDKAIDAIVKYCNPVAPKTWASVEAFEDEVNDLAKDGLPIFNLGYFINLDKSEPLQKQKRIAMWKTLPQEYKDYIQANSDKIHAHCKLEEANMADVAEVA